MKLGVLRVDDLRRAIEIYLGTAYPLGAPVAFPEAPPSGVAAFLGRFDDESQYHGADLTHRYALRLGNERHRHMKLAFTEYLVAGEYFLQVDSHDEADVPRDSPGYELWQELRSFNLGLKTRIETRWRDEGLPTLHGLRQVLGVRTHRLVLGTAPLVLLVDDDPDLLAATEAVLSTEGYRVETACHGEEGLRRALELRPDLVILDHQMPRMTGGEVCRALRADPGARGIPLLLTTATPLPESRGGAADAILYKPFLEKLFLSHVSGLVHRADPTRARSHRAG